MVGHTTGGIGAISLQIVTLTTICSSFKKTALHTILVIRHVMFVGKGWLNTSVSNIFIKELNSQITWELPMTIICKGILATKTISSPTVPSGRKMFLRLTSIQHNTFALQGCDIMVTVASGTGVEQITSMGTFGWRLRKATIASLHSCGGLISLNPLAWKTVAILLIFLPESNMNNISYDDLSYMSSPFWP